jgi:hypothetical protein
MTKLLERAIQQVKALSDDRQNDVSEIILSLVEQDGSDLQLSDEQVREVERRMANPGIPAPYEVVFAYFNKLVSKRLLSNHRPWPISWLSGTMS